jgi:enamine deaminase RidA (YjgF/YER057c/UK114 family)
LSGLGPRNRDGIVEDEEIGGQTRAVLGKLATCLTAVGASLSNVCMVTTYLADISRDFDAYNEAYAAAFPDAPPARTTVQAVLPGILIELQAVAVDQRVWNGHTSLSLSEWRANRPRMPQDGRRETQGLSLG